MAVFVTPKEFLAFPEIVEIRVDKLRSS